MPNLALGHSRFWRARGNAVVPVTNKTTGYPAWQASVICGAVFGVPLDPLVRLWQRLVWTLGIARRAWGWPAAKRDDVVWWLDRPAPTPPPVLKAPVHDLRASEIDGLHAHVMQLTDALAAAHRAAAHVPRLELELDAVRAARPVPMAVADPYADLGHERRQALALVVDTLRSPLYAVAQRAVRQIATKIGFTGSADWLTYHRLLEQQPGRRENLMRHVAVTELLHAAALERGTPLTNPACHLLAEVAYHGFTTQDERAKRIEPRTVMVS